MAANTLWTQLNDDPQLFRTGEKRTSRRQKKRVSWFFEFVTEKSKGEIKRFDQLSRDHVSSYYRKLLSYVEKGELSEATVWDQLYAINRLGKEILQKGYTRADIRVDLPTLKARRQAKSLSSAGRVKLKEVGRIKRGNLEKGYIQFQLEAQKAEERVAELEGQLNKAMNALQTKESQNIEKTMLLEDKKFLLFKAQSELDACKKYSEDLEKELSLLKRQMEYIHHRVDKGFLSSGTFNKYLKDFYEQQKGTYS
jgi:hypothetical protein